MCSWCSSEFPSSSNLRFCVHGAVLNSQAAQISGFVFMVQFWIPEQLRSQVLCSWCSSEFSSSWRNIWFCAHGAVLSSQAAEEISGFVFMVQFWIPEQLRSQVLCSWVSSEFPSNSNLRFCVHAAVLNSQAAQISGIVFMVQFWDLKQLKKSLVLCSWCSSEFSSTSNLIICVHGAVLNSQATKI